MSYTYSSYKSQLANLMAVSETDPSFVTWLPGCIDYAEQRIYRELDLVHTTERIAQTNLTPNSRVYNLPNQSTEPRFFVVQNVNVITPAGATVSNGTRNPLTPISQKLIDFLYPTEAGAGIPSFYAMNTDQQIIVGPSPNGAFLVEVIGTYRPTPLSVSNTETYLSQYLPDLFMAASMVYGSGFMRNFGAQGDDPKMSTSWEGQYQILLASANSEETRKKFNATFGKQT